MTVQQTHTQTYAVDFSTLLQTEFQCVYTAEMAVIVHI